MGERGITVGHMMECNLERFHLLGVLRSLSNCSWVLEVASQLQQEHVGECIRQCGCIRHTV